MNTSNVRLHLKKHSAGVRNVHFLYPLICVCHEGYATLSICGRSMHFELKKKKIINSQFFVYYKYLHFLIFNLFLQISIKMNANGFVWRIHPESRSTIYVSVFSRLSGSSAGKYIRIGCGDERIAVVVEVDAENFFHFKRIKEKKHFITTHRSVHIIY